MLFEDEDDLSDDSEESMGATSVDLPAAHTVHPAIQYQTMTQDQRNENKVPINSKPGYSRGFPPELCVDLALSLDVDSSIVIRKKFEDTVNVFITHRPMVSRVVSLSGGTIKVNTDIKSNACSMGVHIQFRNSTMKQSINKDPKYAMSYEIGEISCNDITHKLHYVVVDNLLWKRRVRDTKLESMGASIVAKYLEKAKDQCMRATDSPLTFVQKQTLQSLNRPDSERKRKAKEEGISSNSIKSMSPPKWNIKLDIMQHIAKRFDLLLQEYEASTSDVPTMESNIQAAMKQTSFFVVSQAGSKATIKYEDLIVLQENAKKRILDLSRSPRSTAATSARVAMEEEFENAVTMSNEVKNWIKHSTRYLFPGLSHGPVFIDIGYQFMFPSKPYLILLPNSKQAGSLLRQLIESFQEEVALSGSEDSESEDQSEEEDEVNSEVIDAILARVETESDIFEDDEDLPGLGNENWNSSGLNEVAGLAAPILETLNQMREDSDEESEPDNLDPSDFEAESEGEQRELLQEAKRFVGTEIELYHDALALILSSPDTARGAADRQSLYRSIPKEGRYLFGTEFGNVYTGYPRIFLESTSNTVNETVGNNIVYNGIEYPKPGPSSCVMYASGLKNTNIFLYNNISEHALNGYGALTKLLLEEEDLMEGEWDPSQKQWKEMTYIIKKQSSNEKHFLEESGKEHPFALSLRLEFRTCYFVGDEHNFVIPWPKGILTTCEVEHTHRYHQYRQSTMECITNPLSNMASILQMEGGKKSIHGLEIPLKNYLVATAAIAENFVNVFASPTNNRYALFKDADHLRQFFDEESQVPCDTNILNVPFGVISSLVAQFYRTEVSQRGLISATMMRLPERISGL